MTDSSAGHHLAQANVARMRAPLDDPLMEDFANQLDPINARADAAPGFVWRLRTETGDATEIRAYDDETILFNMSVWEPVEALFEYVYRSEHIQPLSNRKAWFLPMEGPTSVLWWIPAGTTPRVEDAKARLKGLAADGPTPRAFTFAKHFPPTASPTA